MRWILLLVAIVALVIAFKTTSPAVLGVALLVCAIAAFGSLFGFARARVEAVAQDQGTREIELLMKTRGKPAPPAPAPRREHDAGGGADLAD